MLVVIGAGLGATYVMGLATTALATLQSERDRRHERDVSPGVAYEVAARRTAGLLGRDLTDRQTSAAGTLLHYGLGIAWAPVYLLLRRAAGWHPVVAGLAAGMLLELMVDEGLNPILGFTAPPQAYPASTHLRGAMGHAVYGGALAALSELGWAVLPGPLRD